MNAEVPKSKWKACPHLTQQILQPHTVQGAPLFGQCWVKDRLSILASFPKASLTLPQPSNIYSEPESFFHCGNYHDNSTRDLLWCFIQLRHTNVAPATMPTFCVQCPSHKYSLQNAACLTLTWCDICESWIKMPVLTLTGYYFWILDITFESSLIPLAPALPFAARIHWGKRYYLPPNSTVHGESPACHSKVQDETTKWEDTHVPVKSGIQGDL